MGPKQATILFLNVGHTRGRKSIDGNLFLAIESDESRTRDLHTHIGVVIPYTDDLRWVQIVDSDQFFNHVILVMGRNSDNAFIE